MVDIFRKDVRREIKELEKLVAKAEAADTHSNTARALLDLKTLMRMSPQALLYDPKVVERVVQNKLLGSLFSSPLENGLAAAWREQLIEMPSDYVELVGDWKVFKESFLARAPAYAQELQSHLLKLATSGTFNSRFMVQYDNCARVMKAEGIEPIMITLSGEGGAAREVSSDEVFYDALVQNVVTLVQQRKFNLTETRYCDQLVSDYTLVRERFEEITGKISMVPFKGGVLLADELFYAGVVHQLKYISQSMDEAKTKILREYGMALAGKGQDYFYSRMEEEGEAKQRDRFEVYAGAFVRFSKNFSIELEETEEDVVQTVSDLREKFFK